MPDKAPAPKQDEMYVGYLPVPTRQRRFLLRVVPAGLAILGAGVALWALSQPSPGTAVWEDAQPVRLRGVVVAKPYPILFTTDASGQTQAVLLVEVGKHGSASRAAPLNQRAATVSGWPLHRDGRRMLELEPADDAVAPDPDPSALTVAPAPNPVGPVTLRGEIVDSKCYLGAMKPGEGKTHKECATLCVRGGIPPMLVTRHDDGTRGYYLLQGPNAEPLDPAIYPLIADPVEVQADLSVWGGVNVLTVKPGSVRRL